MGFIPLRAVHFQSVLVAAAAAHTSLLKKRNINQHQLYNLFYIITIIIIIYYIHVYIYIYTHKHICLYIYSHNYDNNQGNDVISENLFTATQGEVSVTMWNFTFSIRPYGLIHVEE